MADAVSSAAVGPARERLSRTASLADPPERLRYVSGKRAEALARLGISSVRDLLLRIPRRYLDFSETKVIGMADVGQEVTVVARVDRVTTKRPRPRLPIVEVSVVDDTGVLVAEWFRQPWVAEQMRQDDLVALSGKVTFSYGFKRMSSPFFEVLSRAGQEGGEGQAASARIVPVHAVGEGVSTAWMRRIESAAVADAGDVCDFLPSPIVARRGLMTLARAIRQAHFPASIDAAEQARRRLAYDELVCLQLALISRNRIRLEGAEPCAHVTDGPRLAALSAALPFELTSEQAQAVDEILADMAAPRAMSRLLMGDVGTGKTVVAAFGLAAAADTGTQAAMMAPTSVLATQYAEKLGPLLDAAGIAWRLVTGATAAEERRDTAARVASGEVSVVFGTTAILSSDISFRRLTFVVVDEQHRFGVGQRGALRGKGVAPDMLSMTATPIPRTLALSVYGDLSVSRIAHRPRPGAGVTTHVIPPESLDLAYGAIREAHAKGQLAYVVCPMIDEADDGEDLGWDRTQAPEGDEGKAPAARPHAATSVFRELSERVFPEMRVGLLTGRMGAAEKDEAMARFKAGETDVLVSTTVIEVGVDVPQATAMLVLDADRFGLATLHQVRGRVGRGDVAGVAYLETSAKRGTPARKRLAALERTSDGQELAELDLGLRHEGQVLGYRQHGSPELRVVDLEADADLVEAAHEDARRIADEDPELARDDHRPLAIEVRDRFGAYYEEVGQP
jgi:ATP-dependent DNA helicase RecG